MPHHTSTRMTFRTLVVAVIFALTATSVAAAAQRDGAPRRTEPTSSSTTAGQLASAEEDDPGSVTPVPPQVTPPVDLTLMECEAGQVDINTASIPALRQALGVDEPVARRVVEGRLPYYLTLAHLRYVAGIGPEKLAQIVASGRACAALPAIPPPTDDHVCRDGDGRIDLNHAADNAGQLTAWYGRPTVDRIIVNGPYSGFAHVLAEAVGGAGKGKQLKNVAKLCVTPPTVESESTTYGWVGAGGGVVTHTNDAGHRFRLTVPAGVAPLQGLWGSTAPADAGAFVAGLVATDARLWGDWNGIVYVGSPPDPQQAALGSEWAPAVLHLPGGTDFSDPDLAAMTIQHSAGISLADGLVTAPADHLSLFLVIAIPVTALLTAAGVYQPWVGWLTDLVRGITGTGAGSPSCSPDITDRTLDDGTLISTSGAAIQGSTSQELVHHCVEPDGADAGRWKLVNNSGAVVTVNEANGADIQTAGWSGNLLQGALFSGINAVQTSPGPDQHFAFFTPGTELRVRSADSFHPRTVQYNSISWASLPATIAWAALGLLPLPGATAGIKEALVDIHRDCPMGFVSFANDIQSGGFDAGDFGRLANTLFSCLGSLGEAAAGYIYDSLGRDASKLTQMLARLNVIYAAAVTTVTVIDVARAFDARGPIDLLFRLPPPEQGVITTPVDPDVGAAPAAGYLIKVPNAPDSYYVVDRLAFPVDSGGVYDCLADRVPTLFEVGSQEFDQRVDSISSTVASCPGGVEHLSLAQIGAWSDATKSMRAYEGFLFRLESGQAYLLRNGLLEPIVNSGGVFECMSRTRWTWDRLSDDELFKSGVPQNSTSVILACG